MSFDPKSHKPQMAYYFEDHIVYVSLYNRLLNQVSFSGDRAQGYCKPDELERAPRFDLVPANFAEDLADAIHRFERQHKYCTDGLQGETKLDRIRALKHIHKKAVEDLANARAEYVARLEKR